MFMVKRLYEKVVAPTPAKVELASIDGCFYLVRPTVTVKGAKECIFQTAIASVRRTSQPYQYELVVCRSATEEEAELLEEEDVDNIDEYVSLIDPHMDFKIQPASEADSDKPGAMALTWLDLAGEEEDSFLFVAEGASKNEIKNLEFIIYRCMWERQHNADGKEVKDDELLQYRLSSAPSTQTTRPPAATPSKQETPKSKKPLFRAPSPSSSDDEIADKLTAHIAKLNVSSDNSSTSPPSNTKALADSGVPPTVTPSKGKGKAKEEDSPAPVMYPVIPANDAEAQFQMPAAAPSPVRVKKEEPKPEPPVEAAPTQEEITNATYDPPDDRKLMITEECDLNLFDKATGMFMLQEANVVSSLWLVKGQTFTCWLSIAGKDGFIWVSTPVDANLPLHFEEQYNSVIISFVNEKTQQNFTWLMKYNDKETYFKMNQAFTQGIFEANNGSGTWSKLKPDEQKYNQAAYEIGDVEMEGAEPWNQEEDEEYAEEDALRAERAAAGDRFGEEELYDEEEEEEDYEESEESEEEEDVLNTGRKKVKNSLLTVGHKGMSFVVRGDMIGVFENEQENGKRKLKFMTNIAGIKRPGSKSTFVPNKVMLHDQDQAMILSDPMNPNAVYKLDLTTGTVTDEWRISEDIQIRNFLPSSKFAQKTGEQTFVGSSRNAVFAVDPRLNKSKLVDSTYKDYKTPFDFTAGVTTADGKLAFATNKGEIKLFDRLGIRAKTAFAQIGREITGIDVTADGRYIVATTKDRLLFVDTSIKEGKNAGRTGFDAAIPAGDRPQVHPLALRPEHAAYMTGGVNFTPAKFNVGEGLEKTIVTSTGPYIVTWNFRAIKAGRFTEYKIKRYEEEIIADNFTWGNDKDIVVTMANDMRMEAKSALMAPSRQSLQPGATVPRKSTGIRRSKNIVKEWDD